MILKTLEQGGLVELLSVFSGSCVQIFVCICGAVSNKDVSRFLSMLRLSSVCEAVLPLRFLENVPASGVLIFNRFPEISENDWDKLLVNCFWGVNLSFKMLLLLEGEGLITAKSIDFLVV